VGAIIHFSNALGVSAVAEGITSLEQLAELRRHGCRYGQGPLMSPPLTEAELRELLSANGNRPIWAT
jgi:EAL domain-containing protein (putative c-di-GMP-specific phosphodiesterase class I)